MFLRTFGSSFNLSIPETLVRFSYSAASCSQTSRPIWKYLRRSIFIRLFGYSRFYGELKFLEPSPIQVENHGKQRINDLPASASSNPWKLCVLSLAGVPKPTKSVASSFSSRNNTRKVGLPPFRRRITVKYSDRFSARVVDLVASGYPTRGCPL